MTGRLSGKLIPAMLARYGDRSMIVHDGVAPAVTVLAAHPEVGDLTICDDGWELTVYVGVLTHGHFSRWDDQPGETQDQQVVDTVLAFLDDVFAERIVFVSDGGQMGGWHPRGEANMLGRSDIAQYVWSGPIEGCG